MKNTELVRMKIRIVMAEERKSGCLIDYWLDVKGAFMDSVFLKAAIVCQSKKDRYSNY